MNLSDNNLTEKTIENIYITPHLKKLVLRNNNIKSSGGRHLLKVVANNTNLSVIGKVLILCPITNKCKPFKH